MRRLRAAHREPARPRPRAQVDLALFDDPSWVTNSPNIKGVGTAQVLSADGLRMAVSMQGGRVASAQRFGFIVFYNKVGGTWINDGVFEAPSIPTNRYVYGGAMVSGEGKGTSRA